MPFRQYLVDRVEPTVKDKIYSHPMELVYSIMGLTMGLMLILGEIVNSYVPSPPVRNLSEWQGYLLGSSLVVGAILTTIALLAPLPDIEAEYLCERVGLAFSALGWATYALAVYIWDPGYGGALIMGIGMCFGGLSRLMVTYVIHKDITSLLWRMRK